MTDLVDRLRSYVEPDDDSEDRTEIRALMIAAANEIELLRKATTRVVEPDPWNCLHNTAIDPDTGECVTCGGYVP